MKKTQLILFFVGLMCCSLGVAQQNISGTVTDESGNPMPGATVLIENTSQGVTTDFDGNYSITVNSGQVLVFSFVGYADQILQVDNQSTIDVQLEPSNSLDEVVVTALGLERNAKSLGYSISQLEGEELSEVKQTNAINALQGKIAGVNITQNSTGAGGSSRVIIRGNSSLKGNNQPLYVVDGITINNDNLGSAGLWGGSDSGDGISSINPDDIASISVLKGGAAAALYGSRASNGVIIVSTKTGKRQKGLGIEYSGSIQFDKANTSILDLQTEYGQGRLGKKPTTDLDADETYSSWGERLDGTSVLQWDGVSRPYSYSGNNVDKFYETSITAINTIALSSVTEKNNVRLSITNLDNQDIVPNSTLRRNSFSLNAGFNPHEKLSVQTNLKYILEDSKGRPRLSDSPGNANYSVLLFSPNIDVLDTAPGVNEDGTEFRTSANTFSQNPYWASNFFTKDTFKDRFIGSINAQFDFTEWLYLRGRIGIDRFNFNDTEVTPWGTAYQPRGSISETKRTFTQIDSDLILGFRKEVVNDFNIDTFIGAGSNVLEIDLVKISGSDFIVPQLETAKNTVNQNTDYDFSKRQIGYAYGSFEVNYKEFVYLTFTGRNDWFSTLSLAGKETPNNDFYSSVSASLVLSDWLTLPEFISYAKLRGGISQVAGGADDPYALTLAYGIYGGHQGASLGNVSGNTIPNREITPFEKNENEYGIDIAFFNDRLSLDYTYYSNETVGDIVGVSASATSGYTSSLANLGSITNKGSEVLLIGKIIQTQNFDWKTSINYSKNTGIIEATNDADNDIALDEPRTRNIQVIQRVGERFGALFGTSYERDTSGNIVYEISDGIPLPKDGGRKILGYGTPSTSIGISNSIRYKNWNLDFLLEGKFDGQFFSGTNATLTGNGLHKQTLDGRESGLTISGTDDSGQSFTTTIPSEKLSAYWGRVSSIAEAFIYETDYLRLRQFSLGYRFSPTILAKTPFSGANVSLIGRNLFFLSRNSENVDPESGYNNGNSQGLEFFGLPITRSVGFSVNLNF